MTILDPHIGHPGTTSVQSFFTATGAVLKTIQELGPSHAAFLLCFSAVRRRPAVLPARPGAYTLKLTWWTNLSGGHRGRVVTENRTMSGEPIDLDLNELLGLSQVAKVSKVPDKPNVLSRVLSKIGFEGPSPGSPRDRVD
jgi:hypothetical protein